MRSSFAMRAVTRAPQKMTTHATPFLPFMTGMKRLVKSSADANRSQQCHSSLIFQEVGCGMSATLIRMHQFDMGCEQQKRHFVSLEHRSEERRVGKGCVSTRRYRWSPHP